MPTVNEQTIQSDTLITENLPKRLRVDQYWLLVSYPHRWGKGKIHGSDRIGMRTWCGLHPHAYEAVGAMSDITCRRCSGKKE